MEKIFFTKHDGGIAIMRNGKQIIVASTHQNYDQILAVLRNREYDKLDSLVNIGTRINSIGEKFATESGKIFVKNGEVFFNDTRNRKTIKLDNTLVDRILSDLGKPSCEKFASALMALLENIQLNKQKDIAPELYEWFAAGKAPITSDGCILAYKKVRSDFKDQYSGKFDNSPGTIVRMKQSEVDTNRENTCSVGLHFCALGYLSKYAAGSNSKVVIVKVNPRHIFAIPKDYNCQKGRASEYFVIGEYRSKDNQVEEAFKDSFVDEDNIGTSAPNVTLCKDGLRPSLLKLAESFDLVENGKAFIIETDGEKIAVNKFTKGSTKMSFETKSVRAAVKAEVERLQE